MSSFWDVADRLDAAKRMWLDRVSAADIAAALSTPTEHCTRNAVLGVLHRTAAKEAGRPGGFKVEAGGSDNGPGRRAGGQPRARRVRTDRPKSNYRITHKPAAGARPPTVPVRREPAADVVQAISLDVPVLSIRDDQCHWPDPALHGAGWMQSNRSLMCGHRTFRDLPYCEYHSRIAYQPVDRRHRERVAAAW